jgi:uncharacterized protein (DUF885 family)
VTRPKATTGQFDELVQAYYHAWFRFHPEAAVDVGVSGYAHLLTPGSDEASGTLICLNDELRVSLEELNPKRLDADRRVDYELLCGAVELENRYLVDIEKWRPDPRRWLPVNAIYQLTIRQVEDIEHALPARLERIPEHLRNAQTDLAAKVDGVPSLWARSTALAARRGADFVSGVVRHPRVAPLAARANVAELAERAAEALTHFADFLERDIAPRARGEFACGAEHFEHLLRHRHFIDVGADQLHAFGERLFERTRDELVAECKERFGHGDYLRAVQEIQTRHPAADKLLGVYRARMRAARKFVVSRKLVTVPKRERLDVVETPAFMRHEIPFAAYSEPAPNDPEQVGRYYVTPPTDAKQLAEHEEVGIAHTCVHEAYPGHHLQFVTANRNAAAHSWPRLLNASASLYEGWALYAEQLMHERGFLDRPESRILLLRDRLWRALRIMLDVELHTRGLTFDAAADRMVAALGFPRSQAEADVAWYTRSPTVPLGYAIGWAIINALRNHVLDKKSGAALRSFHDRLLSVGSIAIPLVIRRAFGVSTWRAVKRIVFGDTNGERA